MRGHTIIREGASAEWYKRRKLTMIAFIIQNLFFGIEYFMFLINLWLYLDQLVDTEYPKLYYSITPVAYLFSASISSVIISRIADKTRQVRAILFCTNIAYIVGNMMWLIPVSPAIFLCGRIVAGIGQASRSVMSGEMARCYPEEEVASMFSILGAFYIVGATVAPVFNIIFGGTDFWIGKWHITYLNVCGIYTPAICLLVQIASICMVSNLSLEYDPKEKREDEQREADPIADHNNSLEENYTSESEEENVLLDTTLTQKPNQLHSIKEKIDEAKNVLYLMKQLFIHCDTALLLAIQLIETYFVVNLDMSLPILLVTTLGWSKTSYNFVVLGSCLFSLFPLLFIMFRTPRDETIYYIALPSLLGYALLQLIPMIWAMKIASPTLDTFLAVPYGIFFTALMFLREVFVGSFLARMVASRFQSLTDSIRLFMARTGAIIATSTAVYVVPNIEIMGGMMVGLMLVLFVLLLSRRSTMIAPTTIIY